MAEEGKKPRSSLADRVIKAGAVAAAIASIVGLVTLVWPDDEPEPTKRDASFDKVDVGRAVSLEEFSSRQDFADAGARGRHATLQLAAVAASAIAQAPDEGDQTPEPEAEPEPQPTGTEPEPQPQTDTSTTPDDGAQEPDGQGELRILEAVEEKLPPDKLPPNCHYATVEGKVEVLCTKMQFLQFLSEGDVEERAGGDQAAASAQALLKVLRETRSRPVAAGKSEPIGVSVSFDLTIEGYEDEEIDIRWSLYDAGAQSRVPRDWLVNRRALVARPEVQSDSAEGEFWIPLPRQSGPYFVRIAAFHGRNRLASEDSKPFQ